jgi:hypothetical protein
MPYLLPPERPGLQNVGRKRSAFRVSVGKPERMRLKRPRRRWKNNIKKDLTEMGWGHGLDRSGSGYG